MATEVSGIKLDTRELDRLTREMQPRAQRIIKATAFAVEGKAKQLAPVDTGALRNSLQSEPDGPYTWTVHDGVEYGVYQELGTYKMRAHPFMTPAVEWARPQFEKQWSDLFK